MARWLLVFLSGCSLGLTGPSASRPRYEAPKCDTSKGLVVADGLLAATLGVVALSVASSSNSSGAIVPVLFSGVFVASAIHGNNEVNACNREMANYTAEMEAAPPSEQRVAQSTPAAYPVQPMVQPTVSMAPPQPQPQPQPLPQSQQQPLPQPEPQAQPQPQPQQAPAPQPAPAHQAPARPSPRAPAAASPDEPWSAFWKEAP